MRGFPRSTAPSFALAFASIPPPQERGARFRAQWGSTSPREQLTENASRQPPDCLTAFRVYYERLGCNTQLLRDFITARGRYRRGRRAASDLRSSLEP